MTTLLGRCGATTLGSLLGLFPGSEENKLSGESQMTDSPTGPSGREPAEDLHANEGPALEEKVCMPLNRAETTHTGCVVLGPSCNTSLCCIFNVKLVKRS